MIVYINAYKNNWISPYTIMEKVFFWRSEDEVYDLGVPAWLEWCCNKLYAIRSKFNKRIEYVKIHRFDTYSMDTTLALIILPMLRQLKETKHGIPSEFIIGADGKEIGLDAAEAKWNAVLDEIIWAFSQLNNEDSEQQFYSGEYDTTKMIGEPGWQGTHKIDMEGLKAHNKRLKEGLELFGKYYLNLWD